MSQKPHSPSSQGWQAELTLGFINRTQRTVLATRKQRGPLAIQRSFYPESATASTQVCHTYLLHPPGGVVGGDQLMINIDVESQAHALITTPGATKFYRSAGQQAQQRQVFNIKQGCLEWLPQENIIFPHANIALSTEIYLDKTATYVGWEIHCLGRPAIQERFHAGQARFYTALYREQRPLLLDRLQLTQPQDLHNALRGLPVVAMLIATPASSELLNQVRAICAEQKISAYVGATLLNEVLIVRALGQSTEEIMRLLRQLWQTIRLPVTGQVAHPPRIWAC